MPIVRTWPTALNGPTAPNAATADGQQTGRQALAGRPAMATYVTARRRPGTLAGRQELLISGLRRAAAVERGSQAADITLHELVHIRPLALVLLLFLL